MSYLKIFRFLFIVTAVLLLAGCQPKLNTATVTGTVTLDGAPIAGVVVQFLPESGGRPAIGLTDTAGMYNLRFTQTSEGCIPGRNRTEFRAYSSPGDDRTQFLPLRYNENSEMSVDVKTGPNVCNFDLLSE